MISCVLSQFSHRLCSPLVQPSKDRGKVVSDLVWEKQSEDLGPDLPWKSLPLLFEFIGHPEDVHLYLGLDYSSPPPLLQSCLYPHGLAGGLYYPGLPVLHVTPPCISSERKSTDFIESKGSFGSVS